MILENGSAMLAGYYKHITAPPEEVEEEVQMAVEEVTTTQFEGEDISDASSTTDSEPTEA